MKTKIAAAIGFIATIVAANIVTTRYGMVPVGLGLTATAGTYFAGLAFILRDLVQDKAGRTWVATLIVAGGALSFLMCAPFISGPQTGPATWWRIALASMTAFLLSEATDFAVYTPLRRRGYIRAAVASNVVGATLDTAVFLSIAGIPLKAAFAGQMVGKIAVTLAVVVLVAAIRYARRPVTA